MSQYSSDPFHKRLSKLIDEFVHSVYDMTEKLPKEELFGARSQLRRAVLSIALNYTEGYARFSKKELARFLKISYGSLKEVLYLIRFSHQRAWIDLPLCKQLESQGNDLGGMLWSTFSRLD